MTRTSLSKVQKLPSRLDLTRTSFTQLSLVVSLVEFLWSLSYPCVLNFSVGTIHSPLRVHVGQTPDSLISVTDERTTRDEPRSVSGPVRSYFTPYLRRVFLWRWVGRVCFYPVPTLTMFSTSSSLRHLRLEDPFSPETEGLTSPYRSTVSLFEVTPELTTQLIPFSSLLLP